MTDSENHRPQLRALGGVLRGLARSMAALEARVDLAREGILETALLAATRRNLTTEAWQLERRAAGLPAYRQPKEPDPREEGWPPVRFGPDHDGPEAVRSELRAYASLLAEVAAALKDVEERLDRPSFLVEGEPDPGLRAAVVTTLEHLAAAAEALR